MTETRVYPDRGSMAAGLAEQVALELSNAIKKRGKATFAVPGGETPHAFFDYLSEMDIEWSCVSVILTDEHYASGKVKKTNSKVIAKQLLVGPAAAAEFVRYQRDDMAGDELISALGKALDDALPIDVCILGVGRDMHTAGLYAEADHIDEALGLWAPSIMVMNVPGTSDQRLTVTAPVLERARKVHVLLTGEEKKQMLREAQKIGPVEEAPVRIVLNRARATTVHYAD